ncbi:MAG: DNA polymerase III subunit chi [Paracoccaceae bacterium]|nr:MAG: DNA polymerase III subunit chi [Paracoccaceae bacterium]
MVEVLFYHLTRGSVESVLPGLLERSLARGWRAVVRSTLPERVAALDAHLWTYADASFLPHGAPGAPFPERQPVWLTAGEEMPNAPDVLFLIDGAPVRPAEVAGLARAVVIFDGADAAAVARAREDWRAVCDAGFTAVYWAQEDGRWREKARAGGTLSPRAEGRAD